MTSIYGLNLAGKNNDKTSNVYAVIKINKTKVGQTETI